MKKAVALGFMFIGLAILAKLSAGKLKNVDWEERFRQMPDDAPPKWMFRNIETIRGNTDRILEILEERRPGG